MQKVGIFGGTFNPVHSEHISLAKTAVKELGLDKLYIMPTHISPHKSGAVVSAKDRLNMLKLAFLDDEKIEVSDFEVKSGGVSYSFITAEHFKKIHSGAEVFMLIGADMLKDFKTWKNPERILDAVTIVACKRQDYSVDFSAEIDYIFNRYNKKIKEMTFNGKSVSSTKIRAIASLSLSVEEFTDKKVADYIKDNELYAGGLYHEYLKRVLPEKRLIHTASVIETALRKAKENNLSEEKVTISALLHDVAKY